MEKQAHVLEKQEEIVLLDAAGIDRLSALLTRGLEQAAVNRKDVIRRERGSQIPAVADACITCCADDCTCNFIALTTTE